MHVSNVSMKLLQKREKSLWKHLTATYLLDVCRQYRANDLKSEAVRVALQAVAQKRKDPKILRAAAYILQVNTSRFDIIAALLGEVLNLTPRDTEVAQTFGVTLMMAGKWQKGLEVFTRLIQQNPRDWARITVAMARGLISCGKPQLGLKFLQSLPQDSCDKKGDVSNLIAVALGAMNVSPQALSWHKKAIARDRHNQSFRQNYALSLLKSGDYKRGWQWWQKRRYQYLSPFKPAYDLPKLRGLEGIKDKHILLYQEQGFGDTIQFIRFLPQLLACGARISIAVPTPLQRLLKNSFHEASFCTMEEIADTARKCEYGLAITDLPYIGGLKKPQDLQWKGPYLHATAEDIARFQGILPAKKPRVGLCWAGGKRPEADTTLVDRRRSLGFDAMMHALTPCGASLVSLQLGKDEEELRHWQGQSLDNPTGKVRDFADTAAIMASLDLVISVDTSVAHLAGALAYAPIWLINRLDSCWRWGDKGTRSSWYPNMYIFRPQQEDFTPLLAQIGQALRHWITQYNAGGFDGSG